MNNVLLSYGKNKKVNNELVYESMFQDSKQFTGKNTAYYVAV